MQTARSSSKRDVTASTFATSDEAWWHARLRSAAHAVVPLHAQSDADAVAAIRDARLDILIDLHGLYSRDARPVLLAARVAPVQATHLGYGASTGARFLSYVFGDRIALPPSRPSSRLFTEKFVLLPPSHLPSGHAALYPHMLQRGGGHACRRRIAARDSPRDELASSRAHLGLHRGLALAYLGQHLKVDPASFASWLSVLRLTPRAILWMLSWPDSAAHLTGEFAAAGVDVSRLVFMNRRPQGEHLCTFCVADLALDAPSYASGATGIDVLWSGVPMVVMGGGTVGGGATLFQRNGVSLATAAGNQIDMVAHSAAGYVQLAAQLARDT